MYTVAVEFFRRFFFVIFQRFLLKLVGQLSVDNSRDQTLLQTFSLGTIEILTTELANEMIA